MANQAITGIPELDMKIINELSDYNLVRFCQTNTYVNSLCKSDYLWQERIKDRYGQVQPKPQNITWQEYYFVIPYYQPTVVLKTFRQLIQNANYPILQILIKIGFFETIGSMAIFMNRLDIFEGLFQRGSFQLTPDEERIITNLAVGNGRINFLDWLAAHGFYPGPEAMIIAIRSKQLPAVQWLHAHGYQVPPEAFPAGRVVGTEEIREWLEEQGAI